MRQQRQELPNKTGHISKKVIQELEKKTFEELSNELFLVGDGKGQEDLMDLYVQLMKEKCPLDDGSFDFDAAMDEVKKKIAKEADSPSSKYDFLQLLSKEDLELLSKAGEGTNEAESLLAAVRKEVGNRDSSNQAPSIRKERTPKENSRKGRSLPWRVIGGIAAIVAVTVTLTLGSVQATGLNVFGYLAQWTGEKLSFIVNWGKVPEPEYLVEFRDMLGEHKIPPELAPTWYPEGFQSDGPIYDEGNLFCDSVNIYFMHEDGREYNICVSHYFSSEDMGREIVEKDGAKVELYTRNGRTFYISCNNDTVTATWGDGLLAEKISGFLSVEEVKQMIDSIGG